jgi:large subunit ribosomal protein L21
MAEIREIKKESKKAEPKAKKAPKTKLALASSSRRATVAKESQNNNGSFAIVETGGKQYRVAVGDTIKIEKVIVRTENDNSGEMKEGDAVVFDKVLLIDNGTDSTDIGTPYIEGAKVFGTLVEIGRNAKVIVIKYKQKSRYFKKNGHRQPFFKVKIDKIG